MMRQQALDEAVARVAAARPPVAPPAPTPQPRPVSRPPIQQIPVPQPVIQERVVTVRRNLTVAELIVVFALACGAVFGVQGLWYLGTDLLPRIEVAPKSR